MATLQRPHGNMKEPPDASAASATGFMNPQQLERYLHDLRHNRPARPNGARPLGDPAAGAGISTRRFQPPNQTGAGRLDEEVDIPKPLSTNSRYSLARHSTSSDRNSIPSHSTERKHAAPYDIPYYERGQRWMERQEAHSLTRALQHMDTEGDARVHAAAQKEAAQLVWKHQNPNAAYPNPDYDYRQHLRKGSHARSQSIGPFKELHVQRRPSTDELSQFTEGTRKVSSGSHGTQSSGSTSSRGGSRYSFSGSLRERAMNSLPLNIAKARNVVGRRMSGRGSRKSSDKSGTAPFSNPEDKIYEEPISEPAELPAHTHESSRPLRVKPRNTSYGKQGLELDGVSKPKLSGPRALNGSDVAQLKGLPDKPSPVLAHTSETRFKNGMEIRSDEIRAATSMKLKDRSANLPQPSAVSDVLGRPIVSFDPGYRAPKKKENSASINGGPRNADVGARQHDTPSVPDIQIDSVPAIAITPDVGSAPLVPIINVDDADSSSKIHPQSNMRARPRPQAMLPPRDAHWSPAVTPARQQAQCAACALGIQGKIVSAANQRFHPQCFACYHCGELLECVAFYPEPEQAREERLKRYEAQLNGHGQGLERVDDNDGDMSARFYCHLDFHEKFSPRCKNCKTPIEGKVVVACGAEWHEGHFFCAECGDPFDQNTPFIEKEGYAWCVPCHLRRFSGKCAGCRKPITDMVVNALEKEWHEECFCCSQCGSQFEDGRFFTSSEHQSPICVSCEERRLKA